MMYAGRCAQLSVCLAALVATAQDPPRTDLHGDPLPPGTRARLGTLQWLHDGAVRFVSYTPDGKHLITATHDGTVQLWDRNTGRVVRLIGKAQNLYRATSWMPADIPPVALAPDGKSVAIGDGDGTIALWGVADGKEIRRWKVSPAGPIAQLVFAPDGQSLVSKDFEQVLYLWDVADGKKLRQFGAPPGKDKWIKGVHGYGMPAFSPDGKFLTAGVWVNRDPSVAVVKRWEVASGKELPEIEGTGEAYQSLTVAPDGRTLAWGYPNGSIRIRDMVANKELSAIAPPAKSGCFGAEMVFSPDSKLLAARRDSGAMIGLWEVATGKEVRQFQDTEIGVARHGNYLSSNHGMLAFAPDGKTLAVSTAANTVHQWDVASGKEIGQLPRHHGGIINLAVAADGKTAVSRGGDDRVRVWDTIAGKELGQLTLPSNQALANFAANGKLLALAGPDDKFQLWDVAGKEVRQWKAPERQRTFAFASDGRTIASRGETPTIYLWDASTGQELRKLVDGPGQEAGNGPGAAPGADVNWRSGHPDRLVFAPDGKSLAALIVGWSNQEQSEHVRISIYEVPGGRKRSELNWVFKSSFHEMVHDQGRTAPITALAFSPDSYTLAVARRDGTIGFWEVTSGKERFQVKVPPRSIDLLTYTPNGEALAIAGRASAVRLLDATSGKELQQFSGHRGSITALAFAADGRTLVSGSADTTGLVWDTSRWAGRTEPVIVELKAQQVEELWTDLADSDAGKAHRAILALRTAPKQVVPLLQERLRPAAAPEPQKLSQLIADLDSNEFAVRQRATDELEKLGELAQPALEKALAGKPTLEMRQRLELLLTKVAGDVPVGAQLRLFRAIEVLEQIGSSQAQQVLQSLAKGAPGARLTGEAKAALRRVAGQ